MGKGSEFDSIHFRYTKAAMAEDCETDLTYAFNNPVYCDWKVAINVENEDPASRSRKRQKKVPVDAEDHAFLVTAIMLAKNSEYFRFICTLHAVAGRSVLLITLFQFELYLPAIEFGFYHA